MARLLPNGRCPTIGRFSMPASREPSGWPWNPAAASSLPPTLRSQKTPNVTCTSTSPKSSLVRASRREAKKLPPESPLVLDLHAQMAWLLLLQDKQQNAEPHLATLRRQPKTFGGLAH